MKVLRVCFENTDNSTMEAPESVATSIALTVHELLMKNSCHCNNFHIGRSQDRSENSIFNREVHKCSHNDYHHFDTFSPLWVALYTKSMVEKSPLIKSPNTLGGFTFHHFFAALKMQKGSNLYKFNIQMVRWVPIKRISESFAKCSLGMDVISDNKAKIYRY